MNPDTITSKQRLESFSPDHTQGRAQAGGEIEQDELEQIAAGECTECGVKLVVHRLPTGMEIQVCPTTLAAYNRTKQ